MAVGSALFQKTAAPASGAAKPDQLPPSELWIKLSSTSRPTKEVPFPRKDPATGEPIGMMLMRPLTQGEILAAQASAEIFAKSLLQEHPDLVGHIQNSPIYENACACEFIFRSCRRIDNPTLPIFPTAASVRDPNVGLTNDECSVLMDQYEIVQYELGPIASYMTEEAQEALIKRLREGGSAVPLASISSAQRIALIMHLVSRHPTSPTDRSSVGSPQDEPSSNSSE